MFHLRWLTRSLPSLGPSHRPSLQPSSVLRHALLFLPTSFEYSSRFVKWSLIFHLTPLVSDSLPGQYHRSIPFSYLASSINLCNWPLRASPTPKESRPTVICNYRLFCFLVSIYPRLNISKWSYDHDHYRLSRAIKSFLPFIYPSGLLSFKPVRPLFQMLWFSPSIPLWFLSICYYYCAIAKDSPDKKPSYLWSIRYN